MTIPFFDPLADEFRWCIYCKADCWPELENQQHADDCPSVTGLYPVDQEMLDLGVRCGYGDADCGHVFKRGEFYMETEVEHHGPNKYVTVACIGCAAGESLMAPPSGGDSDG